MLRMALMAGLVSTIAAPGLAAVDEQALGMLAEAVVLGKRCKDLKGDLGKIRAFANGVGVDEAQLNDPGHVNDYLVMRAAEFEVEYAPLSREGACAKARYFYGPEGTKIPGLLKKP